MRFVTKGGLAKGEIGFVGLGHMGAAMADNLSAAGHRVIGYVRRPDQMSRFVAHGLKATTDISTLFDCDVVITMLPDDNAVRDVVFGRSDLGVSGLAAGLRPGAIHLSMSTISTTAASLFAGRAQASRAGQRRCAGLWQSGCGQGVGLEWHSGQVVRNATRERILTEIGNSLRRLQTDYIDIYQVHWPDPLVDVAETAEAMYSLYRDGKIHAIGVSNFSIEQMERFRSVAPLHVLQAPHNLFEREIEAEALPYCLTNNISTFGYGALCRGLLSGRMDPKTSFAGDDLRRTDLKFRAPRFSVWKARH